MGCVQQLLLLGSIEIAMFSTGLTQLQAHCPTRPLFDIQIDLHGLPDSRTTRNLRASSPLFMDTRF